MPYDLLKHLADKLQAEIAVISEDMARGSAKDHGEYKYACGIVRGLMVANSLLADAAKQLEEDDD